MSFAGVACLGSYPGGWPQRRFLSVKHFLGLGNLFLGSWCKFLPCLATCESQNASAEEMTKIHTCPFPWMHWNCWLSSNLWLSCIELDCRSECWKVCSEVVEERKTFKTSKSSIPFLRDCISESADIWSSLKPACKVEIKEDSDGISFSLSTITLQITERERVQHSEPKFLRKS